MNAGPALADDDGCIGPRGDNGKCIGVETDRGDHEWNDCDWKDCDFDRHGFDHHEFDEAFVELDDCELFVWDHHRAIYVCEVDYDW
jgi:hypothetical protein